MIKISHRGNLTGPNPTHENHPNYIDKAISKGYDCEVDVRYLNTPIGNKIFLGHDKAQYSVDMGWLFKRKTNLWIHCKDLDTLSKFTTHYPNFNYFFHESDLGVLTSFHYIWSINNVNNGILVMPEIYNTEPNGETLGICSDFIETQNI